MIERCVQRIAPWRRLGLGLCTLVLLLFVAPVSTFAATPVPRLNGAGLVIQHGDGQVLYFYVQFTEPHITGEQLLERAGVQLDITPYAGVGTGVCMIDHEGCPSSNCFCKSFAVPSVYWRYHSLNADGRWVYRATGPTQRVVHDGDVDGWSWSGDDGALPTTSIDAIAKLNGITRLPAKDSAGTPGTDATATAASITTPDSTASPVLPVASVTPRVAGVAIAVNGTATPLDPVPSNPHQSDGKYVWFGASVAALLLVGLVLALRHRTRRAP